MNIRELNSQMKAKTEPSLISITPKSSTATCEYCGVKKGEVHPLRGFTVSLLPVPGRPDKKGCQVCRIHYRKRKHPVKNKQLRSMHGKTHIVIFFIAFVVLLALSGIAFAQPPGLPTAPSQAPIDGGLSVLAVAGGVYAVKKLRDKKE